MISQKEKTKNFKGNLSKLNLKNYEKYNSFGSLYICILWNISRPIYYLQNVKDVKLNIILSNSLLMLSILIIFWIIIFFSFLTSNTTTTTPNKNNKKTIYQTNAGKLFFIFLFLEIFVQFLSYIRCCSHSNTQKVR